MGPRFELDRDAADHLSLSTVVPVEIANIYLIRVYPVLKYACSFCSVCILIILRHIGKPRIVRL